MLAFEGPQRAIHGALREAGVTLNDLSFAEVHDCFTIAELLIYEAMGLAPRGEGHRALDDGIVRQAARPGGRVDRRQCRGAADLHRRGPAVRRPGIAERLPRAGHACPVHAGVAGQR
ncbi:hypothetical protein WR25_17773 [Diploscapter pachys]|uniref:Thiolase C-terminal domain-containing protein n=1 Tax=Diploscapter pachys TaxID=2018661 RepID=A0A2A2KFI7_9BILA|nr:hypothetical protein WR25_17773 [Diploscapter pachys]